jgi:hypothetical protein
MDNKTKNKISAYSTILAIANVLATFAAIDSSKAMWCIVPVACTLIAIIVFVQRLPNKVEEQPRLKFSFKPEEGQGVECTYINVYELSIERINGAWKIVGSGPDKKN